MRQGFTYWRFVLAAEAVWSPSKLQGQSYVMFLGATMGTPKVWQTRPPAREIKQAANCDVCGGEARLMSRKRLSRLLVSGAEQEPVLMVGLVASLLVSY